MTTFFTFFIMVRQTQKSQQLSHCFINCHLLFLSTSQLSIAVLLAIYHYIFRSEKSQD